MPGQTGPGVSVTLLAGPLTTRLEEYAQVYTAGNTLASSKQEERRGASGRSYLYSSDGGRKRHRLLLLEEQGRVYGLYAQGDSGPFEHAAGVLDRMFESLSLERPARYRERRDATYGYALRLPDSWQSGRRLSRSDRLVSQYLSPALAADRGGQTVHASLTVSVEAAAGGLPSFYQDTRQMLGESFQLLDHASWRDGYADVMKTETPLATSRIKRFYRAAEGRGYILAFEAREDVFDGVVAWFGLIADTLKVGPELAQ